MRPLFFLLLLGLAPACADGDDGAPTGDDDDDDTPPADPCEPSDAPTLAIGLGLEGYEALDEGDPFPLIHGPQGGVHLEIGLFGTGLAAGELVSGEMHGYIDGDEYASAFPRLDLRCVGEGRESYGTLLVYGNSSDDADFLDGQTTRITVSVTGTDGSVVSAEGSFVIEDTR